MGVEKILVDVVVVVVDVDVDVVVVLVLVMLRVVVYQVLHNVSVGVELQVEQFEC